MVMPPVPQLPAQHPSAPFCQMTWAVGVGVGLDDVLLEQEDRKAAPVAKRPATTPDIRNFIILSEGDSLSELLQADSGRARRRRCNASGSCASPAAQPCSIVCRDRATGPTSNRRGSC